ncbi:hypothetical protein JCM9279_003695 [Rhodotorula babjevae]
MAIFNNVPIELVRHIWSFLAFDPAGKRHLCRALVPLVRHHNLGWTCIMSKERLSNFASLVERSDPLSRWFNAVKSVGESVRNLELYHIMSVLAVDPVAIRKALIPVNFILRRCPEVESLTVHGQSAMPVLLSAPAFPSLNLPKLKKLSLYDVAARTGSLLLRGHFAHLRRFPALRDLVIDLDWDEGDAFDSLQTAPPRTHGLSPVTSLSLYAGESLVAPSAALFIADFAQLTRLEISLRAGVDLGPFLQACPVTLTVLTIHYCDELLEEGDALVPLHVETDLARFVHLTDLKLGADIYSPTCELFRILSSHLPRLRTLTLERRTRLVANKLLNYVLARGGPARQLDKVVLDSIDAHMRPLPSERPDYPGVEDGTFNFRYEWTRPKWTRRFGLADARALIAAAERVGVELEGETVRAVEYDEVRAREEAYLQMRRDDILYSLRGLFGEGDGEGEV